LCAAYYLRKAGAPVTVLEMRRAGRGASSGNAGWITHAQAGSLPEPGLIGYGLRSLVDPGSGLYFEPRQLARMIPWLVRFLRRFNEREQTAERVVLGRLGGRCFELLEGMAADGVDFPLERRSFLACPESRRGGDSGANTIRSV
jgi:D-amino-acid dehydrogenase